LWDAQSGQKLADLSGHKSAVTSVAFSPEGRRVLSISGDFTVWLWDAQNGRELTVLRGHKVPVNSAAFSPDGCHVLNGSDDKTVRLWDAHSRRELTVLRGHEHGVYSVAFSPDGCRVLSGSGDNTVRIWDTHDWSCVEILRGHGDFTAIAAGPVAFPWRAMSRDGETVVEPAIGGLPVAWFPNALHYITTHIEGRIWVGGVGNHLVLLRMEGA
jgi:WD40 repeat protein